MTLALENVSKIVGSETHIDGVSLELVEGSFNVLLGRTLSGKTTLMRLMAGLGRPTSSMAVSMPPAAGIDESCQPYRGRSKTAERD